MIRSRTLATLPALLAGALLFAPSQPAGAEKVATLAPSNNAFAVDLTGVLPQMGRTDAFDGGKADFSGMTKQEKLFIGAVLHKAFVAVDEEGTEAAAATVIAMRGGRAPTPAEPIALRADHPLLFVIRHNETGRILFMGRVDDPTP